MLFNTFAVEADFILLSNKVLTTSKSNSEVVLVFNCSFLSNILSLLLSTSVSNKSPTFFLDSFGPFSENVKYLNPLLVNLFISVLNGTKNNRSFKSFALPIANLASKICFQSLK